MLEEKEFWKNSKPGDWFFVDEKRFCFRYGPGKGHHFHISSVPVVGENAWEWNGDKEAPTISPSIKTSTTKGVVLFHGFMRDGELEYLSDSTVWPE